MVNQILFNFDKFWKMELIFFFYIKKSKETFLAKLVNNV